MSANLASVINQGEFHSSVNPSKPMQKSGHAPGKKVDNDASPEFAAQTLPAGTAPADRTFLPNPIATIPGQSYPESKRETWQTAQSTIGGATSADVTATLGNPVYRHTEGELKHQESHGSGSKGVTTETDSIQARGLDRDQLKGGKVRDDATQEERANMKGAEERESESAATAARLSKG